MDTPNTKPPVAVPKTRRVVIHVAFDCAAGTVPATTLALGIEAAVRQAIAEGMSRIDSRAVVQDCVTSVEVVVPGAVADAQQALGLCRRARDLLLAAGATRAVQRLRQALSSIDGAVRAAGYREGRAARS